VLKICLSFCFYDNNIYAIGGFNFISDSYNEPNDNTSSLIFNINFNHQNGIFKYCKMNELMNCELMNCERINPASIVMNNRLYVVDASCNKSSGNTIEYFFPTISVEVYDCEKDEWQEYPNLIEGYLTIRVVNVNNKNCWCHYKNDF
jgi:hypothetical protein